MYSRSQVLELPSSPLKACPRIYSKKGKRLHMEIEIHQNTLECSNYKKKVRRLQVKE